MDLMPSMGPALSNWQTVTNQFRINTIGGLYELMEFYVESTPVVAGGDDKAYRLFQNLPPHYTVKLRFFVLRSASSTMTLNYYIDKSKFSYDYNQYPSSQTLGDIVTTEKILHQNTNLTVAF